MRPVSRSQVARVRNVSGLAGRTTTRRAHTALLLLTALATVASGGCSSLGPLAVWKANRIREATDADPVVEVLCLWQPAEGRGLNGLPTRGFAGQIMFFTRRSPEPVRIDGDVRIYLFENRGTVEERAKPVHQFDFIGKVWDQHLQQGTLGTSYHVFIPFTREHEWQTECVLRVRLTPPRGAAVYSELASVTLPGMEEPGTGAPAKEVAVDTIRRSLQQQATEAAPAAAGTAPPAPASGTTPAATPPGTAPAPATGSPTAAVNGGNPARGFRASSISVAAAKAAAPAATAQPAVAGSLPQATSSESPGARDLAAGTGVRTVSHQVPSPSSSPVEPGPLHSTHPLDDGSSQFGQAESPAATTGEEPPFAPSRRFRLKPQVDNATPSAGTTDAFEPPATSGTSASRAASPHPLAGLDQSSAE